VPALHEPTTTADLPWLTLSTKEHDSAPSVHQPVERRRHWSLQNHTFVSPGGAPQLVVVADSASAFHLTATQHPGVCRGRQNVRLLRIAGRVKFAVFDARRESTARRQGPAPHCPRPTTGPSSPQMGRRCGWCTATSRPSRRIKRRARREPCGTGRLPRTVETPFGISHPGVCRV
jgi:hypothetical protein